MLAVCWSQDSLTEVRRPHRPDLVWAQFSLSRQTPGSGSGSGPGARPALVPGRHQLGHQPRRRHRQPRSAGTAWSLKGNTIFKSTIHFIKSVRVFLCLNRNKNLIKLLKIQVLEFDLSKYLQICLVFFLPCMSSISWTILHPFLFSVLVCFNFFNRTEEILSEIVLGHWMPPSPLVTLPEAGSGRGLSWAPMGERGKSVSGGREERGGGGAGLTSYSGQRSRTPSIIHSTNIVSVFTTKNWILSEIVFWSLSQTDVDDIFVVVVSPAHPHSVLVLSSTAYFANIKIIIPKQKYKKW